MQYYAISRHQAEPSTHSNYQKITLSSHKAVYQVFDSRRQYSEPKLTLAVPSIPACSLLQPTCLPTVPIFRRACRRPISLLVFLPPPPPPSTLLPAPCCRRECIAAGYKYHLLKLYRSSIEESSTSLLLWTEPCCRAAGDQINPEIEGN